MSRLLVVLIVAGIFVFGALTGIALARRKK